jgi:hypothetical protein
MISIAGKHPLSPITIDIFPLPFTASTAVLKQMYQNTESHLADNPFLMSISVLTSRLRGDMHYVK